MAFEPLKDRIGNLPLVISGPILRAVNENSVSVWVALKKEEEVQLIVYEWADTEVLTPKFNGTTTTVAIGENLHIAVVTSEVETEKLKPNQLYYYDLFIDGKSLLHEGIIDFKIYYEYEDSLGDDNIEAQISSSPKLPSFSLPSDDLNELRIVHGSCRKPDKEGLDAMPAIDDMIAGDWTRVNNRPHFLFLTGDQIYADDVSPYVLKMLIDASAALLGNTKKETFDPITIEKNIEIKEHEELTFSGGKTTWNGKLPKPNKRGKVINRIANFSDDNFHNHLMSFGEYCAMYLFVWSDNLWGDFEDFKSEFPDQEKHIGRLKEFVETLPKVRRALANVPTYMIFDDHEVTDDWNMTSEWCKKVYTNTLGRRIIQNGMLAYTLFQAWGNTPERYIQGTVGRSVLDKIVSWDEKGYFKNNELEIARPLGLPLSSDANDILKDVDNNDYQIFKNESDESKILKWNYQVIRDNFEIIVVDGRTKRGYPYLLRAAEDEKRISLYPSIFHLATFEDQIPTIQSDPSELSLIVFPTSLISIPAIDFDEFPTIGGFLAKCVNKGDETIDFFDHWRNQSEEFEALLLHISARGKKRDSKIETRNVILTGDVHFAAASRLLYQNNRLSNDTDKTPCHSVFAQFASSSFKKQDGKTRVLHYHGYKFRTVAGEAESQQLNQKLRSLISFLPEVVKDSIGVLVHIVFFTLEKTFALLDHIDPFDFFEPKLPDARKFLGWEAAQDFGNAQHLKVVTSRTSSFIPSPPSHKNVPVQPIMILTEDTASNVVEPQLPKARWRYKIDYILAEDEVRANAPANFNMVGTPSLASKDEALKQYLIGAKNHLEYAQKYGSGKEVVGLNNVSELRFDWKNEEKTAIQKTWWHLAQKDKEPTFFPLTKYKVSLDFKEDDLPQI